MGYKALYRMYRPDNFDDVAGQKHIVKTLQQAVKINKIGHAYLFCGPRGTGKTSIAKIFAKMINCDGTESPCNKCDNCNAANDGNHPDIIEIDAASNNGVDEVRSLIEKVKYAPLRGKYKIYIIDEVHMMSTGAFNALLKTIEEPPEHVIFIFATTEPNKVIPTIISRCQRFDFTKVPLIDMVERMNKILSKENLNCEKGVVELIAQLADGGLRDALSILDQCLAYAQDNITIQQLNDIYGITTLAEKIEIISFVDQGKADLLLNKIKVLLDKGIDILRITSDFINIFKESIVYELTNDISLLKELDNESVNSALINFTNKQRFEIIDVLMETLEKYRNASDAGSYLEVCLLRMIEIRHNGKATNSTEQRSTEQNIIKETYSVDRPQPNDKCDVDTIHKETREERSSSLAKSEENDDVSRETIEGELNLQEIDKKIEVEDIENADNDEHVSRETKKEYLPADTRETIMSDTQTININAANVSAALNASKESESDESMIQLLSGASKPEREADMANWDKITKYCLDFEWASIANSLKTGVLFASGKNYCLISVESNLSANNINERCMNDDFLKFTRLIFNRPKKIFAVTAKQQKRLVEMFKELMIAGKLPEPLRVPEIKIEDASKQEMSKEESIEAIFGKDNIKIEEE